MNPLLRRVLGESEDKLSQQTVLYLTPEQIGNDSGAHCGACFFFHRPTSECFLTSPSKCNAEHGVCGYFLGGNLWEADTEGKCKPVPQKLIPKADAGYIEDAPTHCGNCEYFQGPSDCKHIKGPVNEDGCCNAWEPK